MSTTSRARATALAILLALSGAACTPAPTFSQGPGPAAQAPAQAAPTASIMPCTELDPSYIDYMVATFGADFSRGEWSTPSTGVFATADTEDGPAFACGSEQ